MNKENSRSRKPDNMTRRDFMRDSTLAAAGLAVGLGAVAGQSTKADENYRKTGTVGGLVKTTRSYNPNMEYRRLGKTGLWISAVCLGGHWKKIPYSFGTEEFKKTGATWSAPASTMASITLTPVPAAKFWPMQTPSGPA